MGEEEEEEEGEEEARWRFWMIHDGVEIFEVENSTETLVAERQLGSSRLIGTNFEWR